MSYSSSSSILSSISELMMRLLQVSTRVQTSLFNENSSDFAKLGHSTGFCKSNRGPVPTGEVFSFQFHCVRIIQKNMMFSVENF